MTQSATDIHDPSAASDNRLVVAISSRALFDLADSHALFQREGLDAYRNFQIAHEEDILKPGVAFPLVQKLLGLNKLAGAVPPVEVILLSRNSGDTGLRIFNAIQYYGLEISLRSMATPYCLAMRASGFHAKKASRRSTAVRRSMPPSRCPSARSAASSPRCITCKPRSLPNTHRSARRWSPRARRLRTSA